MMGWTLSSPDGTEAAEFEPVYESIGDGVIAPRSFTWRRHRPGDHVVEIDVVVSEGQAHFKEVRVRATDERPSVTARDLNRLPLPTMLEHAVRFASGIDRGAGRMPFLHGTADEDTRREVASRRTASRSSAAVRRPITDDLLRAAADTYRAVKDNGGTVRKAATEFDVSEAQMYRYLRLARDRGFLPESGWSS